MAAPEPDDEPPVQRFLRDTLPAVLPGHTSHAVCMYTVTPDRNFVIDLHPLCPQVTVVGGFSGHGFKFASVVGEIAGDLALEGETPHSEHLREHGEGLHHVRFRTDDLDATLEQLGIDDIPPALTDS